MPLLEINQIRRICDRNCRFITPFVRGLAGRLW